MMERLRTSECERQAKPLDLLAPTTGGIVLNEHIEAHGATMFRHACNRLRGHRLELPDANSPSGRRCWKWSLITIAWNIKRMFALSLG